MSSSFDFYTPPFDVLTVLEQDKVLQSLDVAYYPKGAEIVGNIIGSDDSVIDSPLYFVLKGEVHQFRDKSYISSFCTGDWFDGKLVTTGRTEFRYIASEEVVAYLLPAGLIRQLAEDNSRFGSLLFADISERLNAVAESDKQREMNSFIMAKIKDAYLREPFYVDGQISVAEATGFLRKRNASHVLVRDGERVGIFTNTNLCDAVLLDRDLKRMPVREASRFELLSIDINDDITEALLLMIRHRVHRLVVMENSQIVGVLGQLDLMSFFSNHSHLIAQQIDMAEDIEALRLAAEQVEKFVRTQYGSGVKISVISRMVQEINLQIFAKLWYLIAPMSVQLNSCLLVMGSEGRGEQVLRTDQDNALLLRDGFECDDIASICANFNQELANMGYPLCTGQMMMNNPLWRQHCSAFKKNITDWLFSSDPEALIYLSTFLDAKVVGGDTTLFKDVQSHLIHGQRDHAGFINRFAHAVEMFGDASPVWWRKFLPMSPQADGVGLDLKKVGIFPIVHGVRSLAWEIGCDATNTKERIEALIVVGVLDAEQGRNLIEAFYFMLELRLKNGLSSHSIPNDILHSADLSALERDLFKDCLLIVKDFRGFISRHFHLNIF